MKNILFAALLLLPIFASAQSAQATVTYKSTKWWNINSPVGSSRQYNDNHTFRFAPDTVKVTGPEIDISFRVLKAVEWPDVVEYTCLDSKGTRLLINHRWYADGGQSVTMYYPGFGSRQCNP